MSDSSDSDSELTDKDKKLLKLIEENYYRTHPINPITKPPLIKSYIAGWEKENLEAFHVLLDKHISTWKYNYSLARDDVSNKCIDDHYLLPRTSLLDLICFNRDVDSFTRVVAGLVASQLEDQDVISIIHDGGGGNNSNGADELSPLGVCFVHGTPEFINSAFGAIRNAFQKRDFMFDAFLKHVLGNDSGGGCLMNLCRWISSVENVKLIFEKFRSMAPGAVGEAVLRGKFNSYKIQENGDDTTLIVAVLRDQKWLDVVKYVFDTVVELGLTKSQFSSSTADVMERICERQQSLDIVNFALDVVPRHFDTVFRKINFGTDEKCLLVLRCVLVACESSDDPEFLKSLFDMARMSNSNDFHQFWNLSCDDRDSSDDDDDDDVSGGDMKQRIITSLFNAVRNNNFDGVWMIFAHCLGDERCRELIDSSLEPGGKTVAASAVPDSKIQRFLEKPEVWKESIEKYKSVFNGETPLVPPWTMNVDHYWWVRRMVQKIEGLRNMDPSVLIFLSMLEQINVTDRKSLGHCDPSELKEVLTQYCPHKKLLKKIEKIAKLEYKKQHPGEADDGSRISSSSSSATIPSESSSLPFLTEIFAKHSIASPLSAASTKILFDNEINSLEIFLQLTDQDLKDLSLPLGAQKVIKEAQKKCTSAPPASSGVSALSRLIASEFVSNCIFLSSDIQFDENHPQPLGSGGGGDVFKATLASTNRPVAVKRFRNIVPDQAIKECKIAMKLHHKNIITFVGVSVFTFHSPYVYEEIRAIIELGQGTLQQTLSSTSLLSWEKVLRYSFEIASGLDYLHNTAKMNHLDLKPANVLLDENNIVKLCDFGLSRVMKNVDDTHVTVSHAGFGTLRWMSPEQLSSTQMRPTNDVYSFGCILYNMIDEQGRKPWYHLPDTNNRNDALLAELTSESNKSESLLTKRISSEHRADCPEFLLDLCKSCLNSDYKMRPKDGGVLVELLKSGVLELCMKSEEWRKCLGDVGSYLGIVFDEKGTINKNKNNASMGSSNKSATNTSFESFS